MLITTITPVKFPINENYNETESFVKTASQAQSEFETARDCTIKETAAFDEMPF